jgi:hypothetical protein
MFEREQPIHRLIPNDINADMEISRASYISLESSFIDALTYDDFEKIEKILKTYCPNPEKRLSITKFHPSSGCLSEAIYTLQKAQYTDQAIYLKHKEITTRLLTNYFIKPNDDCLCYAIMNQQHDIINILTSRYHMYLESNENTLQYAISACNVNIVYKLLFKYKVQIDPELFEYIYEERETEDDFPIEERRKRNRIIRRMIKKALHDEENEHNNY